MTVVVTASVLEPVRAALAATLTTEFAAEGIAFASSKMKSTDALSEASGAVFCMGWDETPQRVNQIELKYGVQIYDAYGSEWSPEGDYDPTNVQMWAERAVVALKANEHPPNVWFIRVPTVRISDDSAGNPSQVELIIAAVTDNPFGF